jgi:hypothetical protein
MNNKKIKIKKTKNQKTKGLRFGSSSGVPAHQAQGPGFDPQNCQNKNKQTNKQTKKSIQRSEKSSESSLCLSSLILLLKVPIIINLH